MSNKILPIILLLYLAGCTDSVSISLQRDNSDLEIMTYQKIVEQHSELNEDQIQSLDGTSQHEDEDPYLSINIVSDYRLEKDTSEDVAVKAINGSLYRCANDDIQTPAESLYIGKSTENTFNYVFVTSINRLTNTQILSLPMDELCLSINDYKFDPIVTPNTKYTSNEIVISLEEVEEAMSVAEIEIPEYQEPVITPKE